VPSTVGTERADLLLSSPNSSSLAPADAIANSAGGS
jgi:hypothetical protein